MFKKDAVVFLKYFFALFITLFLGPGVGHLFLGKYKRSAVLIGLSVFFVAATAFVLISGIDLNSVPRDYNLMLDYTKKLISDNSGKMLMLDVPLALIWAYALLDVIMEGVLEYKEKKKK
ncbi:MAG: hypothetical protein LBQ47_06220 [Endomicrobium sp.]|nr:hypothetical protein [Endomicrobium sp.]